jgi:rhodanese-related sulfurtransferase
MSDVKRVSPQEAKALLDEGWVYVDVRTPEEWAAGHPAGATNVPWALTGPAGMTPNPAFLPAMEKLHDKAAAKLILGCKTGGRSLKAATALVGAGFTNVVDQRAGWEGPRDTFGQVTEPGWKPAGLPAETETPGGSWPEQKTRAGV